MLSPVIATIILLSVAILLLVIVPALDSSKRFGKYISLRYTLVVVVLCMALGCVLNFSHLIESSRNIVLMGGIILTGIFIIVRSLEKVKLGNKKFNLEVSKGDLTAKTSLENKDEENK